MSVTVGDIKDILLELEKDGHKPEVLEGLLVNEEDLKELTKGQFTYYYGSDHNKDVGSYDNNEMYIYGVKIISNPHIERGTVFKLFKKDSFSMAQINDIPTTGSISNDLGIIHSPKFYDVLEHSNGTKAILPTVFDDFELEANTEPVIEVPRKEKKHSKTRKVQLK